jgi:hypothetical protein
MLHGQPSFLARESTAYAREPPLEAFDSKTSHNLLAVNAEKSTLMRFLFKAIHMSHLRQTLRWIQFDKDKGSAAAASSSDSVLAVCDVEPWSFRISKKS